MSGNKFSQEDHGDIVKDLERISHRAVRVMGSDKLAIYKLEIVNESGQRYVFQGHNPNLTTHSLWVDKKSPPQADQELEEGKADL